MTCIDCVYYSMWEGVCMCPISPNLWISRNGGDAEACKDFEKDENLSSERIKACENP